MAVLVVLLAAMLFVGSAAALTDTDMDNLTVKDQVGSTLALGIGASTLSFNVTNVTTDGEVQSPALDQLYYSWNTTGPAILVSEIDGNNAIITLNGAQFTKAGQYTLQFYDDDTITGANVNVSETAKVTFNVVNAVEVEPTNSPNTAPNVFVRGRRWAISRRNSIE